MKERFFPLVAWIVSEQARHRARAGARRLDELSDHIRRDAGLPPRNPLFRTNGRGRFLGLPT